MIVCDSSVSFFFFKQKTAYEMRISDWSSDVCSSDLPRVERLEQLLHVADQARRAACAVRFDAGEVRRQRLDLEAVDADHGVAVIEQEIGRASCRERVCQYV